MNRTKIITWIVIIAVLLLSISMCSKRAPDMNDDRLDVVVDDSVDIAVDNTTEINENCMILDNGQKWCKIGTTKVNYGSVSSIDNE